MTSASAPGLRELQRWFASVASHPRSVLEQHRDPRHIRKLERLVTPGPRLSAIDRFQIYNDSYFARLVECLTDDYPALGYALGEHVFASLSRAYIASHPSRSRSLNAYGQHLAAFCATHSGQPWAAFAADLARLEWALVEVVHEPASTSLVPDALASIPPAGWQTARLLPSRSVRLLGFDYPVNDFFQAFRDDRAPQLPGPAPSAAVIYRQGLGLWRMGLEPLAARLLKDLFAGVPLAVAVTALEARSQSVSTGDDLARQLPHWLGTWVQSGFFRGIELD